MNAPFLDNWPVYRQLWNTLDCNPGDEVDLSSDLGRNLTAVLKDGSGAIAATYGEGSGIEVTEPATRGVVRLQITDWLGLSSTENYTVEISAYSNLYERFSLFTGVPTGQVNLNGVEVYGSPREILEVVGQIPGADVRTLNLVTGGWAKDARRYWVQSFDPANEFYGLWIDDKHARQVSYKELAIASERCWALVRGTPQNTIFYKGDEDLTYAYVETAFSRYVLRSLEEATAEIERKTGRFFNRQRVFMELHNGTYRQVQISLRQYPVDVDEFFRIDLLGRNHSVWKRYTETASDLADPRVHVESETGIITLVEDFWSWGGYGNYDYGFVGRPYSVGQTLPGLANIRVTFTAGFENPPTDLAEACANLAAIRQIIFWSQRNTQGLSSINIGCVSMNFAEAYSKWIPAWQSGADQIIDAYRNYSITGT